MLFLKNLAVIPRSKINTNRDKCVLLVIDMNILNTLLFVSSYVLLMHHAQIKFI